MNSLVSMDLSRKLPPSDLESTALQPRLPGWIPILQSSLALAFSLGSALAWKPVDIPVMSTFGAAVTPDAVLPEHPRPQLQRDAWSNLNGLWDYAITPLDAPAPTLYDGQILVPYCVQSSLSGVRKLLTLPEVREHALWYHRALEVPAAWHGKRLLLHFGAVDWETQVWVNGLPIGTHRGGYIPFTFDITDALRTTGEQRLVIRVTDAVGQVMGEPIGKQNANPDEYDTVTGIWQTVWLEPVPELSVRRLQLTPDIDRSALQIQTSYRGDPTGAVLEVEALDNGSPVARATGPADHALILPLTHPKLWHPDHPFLYGLRVRLRQGGQVTDEVESYFGMRKVSVAKVDGVNRILLNNETLFMAGPLDQGMWPESVLTPPSEEAIEFDLGFLKQIGCNMVRLHVNGKPDRWYAACDRLGLVVWQDFVCGPHGKRDYSEPEQTQWMAEQRGMVEALYNHPSVVMWVLFNEGWGQHEAEAYSQWAGRLDPTRLITAASGFDDVPGLGHVRDMHIYINNPAIALPESEPERAVVLGEWGGFTCIAEDNNWAGRKPGRNADNEWVQSVNWPTYSIGQAFLDHYTDLVEQLLYLKELGLCGAVYTQIADMKVEQNGYLSMDRQVTKTDPAALRVLHDRLIQENVVTHPLLEASLVQPQVWRYADGEPNGDWTARDYDDTTWETGVGPFGHTPGIVYPNENTSWTTDRLYLRKTFELDNVPERACLRTYVYGKFPPPGEHGILNTCDIYLNGQKVKEVYRWHLKSEELQVMTIALREEALRHLQPGPNQVAIQVNLPSPIPRKLYDFGIYAVR